MFPVYRGLHVESKVCVAVGGGGGIHPCCVV